MKYKVKDLEELLKFSREEIIEIYELNEVVRKSSLRMDSLFRIYNEKTFNALFHKEYKKIILKHMDLINKIKDMSLFKIYDYFRVKESIDFLINNDIKFIKDMVSKLVEIGINTIVITNESLDNTYDESIFNDETGMVYYTDGVKTYGVKVTSFLYKVYIENASYIIVSRTNEIKISKMPFDLSTLSKNMLLFNCEGYRKNSSKMERNTLIVDEVISLDKIKEEFGINLDNLKKLLDRMNIISSEHYEKVESIKDSLGDVEQFINLLDELKNFEEKEVVETKIMTQSELDKGKKEREKIIIQKN